MSQFHVFSYIEKILPGKTRCCSLSTTSVPFILCFSQTQPSLRDGGKQSKRQGAICCSLSGLAGCGFECRKGPLGGQTTQQKCGPQNSDFVFRARNRAPESCPQLHSPLLTTEPWWMGYSHSEKNTVSKRVTSDSASSPQSRCTNRGNWQIPHFYRPVKGHIDRGK